ncbi:MULTISPECIES: hypothetical protein [Ferrimicrobium]|uniref:hypothetical protein n=1 Tax=Ferrimicrobium TaxID=121038 RepID=UPI0023F01A0D|nr:MULTISPECIES: hypothetical protein [Ferrimicrobium]
MVEWLVVVNSDSLLSCLVILIDVDLGEERLIEEPSGAVIGFQVGGMTVSSQIERVSQDRSRLLEVRIKARQLICSPGELTSNPLLFAL